MSFNEFYDTLDSAKTIALATSAECIPNVRIVNFCYDKSRLGVLYFATDRENQKVKEFALNNRVAFTTIPLDVNSIPHIRSQQAKVCKSEKSLADVQDLFVARIPGYDKAIAAIGESLDVFEVHVEEAVVILGFDAVKEVRFQHS